MAMRARMRAAVHTVVATQAFANAATDARSRCLDDAADRGDIPALLQELAADPEILSRSSHSYSALHRAAERGHTDAVHTLLLHGADAPNILNARTGVGGNTPLHLAAQRGSIGVVQKLLNASALEVDATNDRGMTAAQVAEYAGRDDIVSVLLAPRELGALSPTGGYSTPRTPRPSEGEPPLSPALARLERDARALALRSQSAETPSEADGELSPTRQELDVAHQAAELRHSLAGFSGAPRRTNSAGAIGARSREPSRKREASQRWQLEASAHAAVTDAQKKAQNLVRLHENAAKGVSSSAGASRVAPHTGFSEELRRHRERARSERNALEGQRVQRKMEEVTRKHAAEAPPSSMGSESSPVGGAPQQFTLFYAVHSADCGATAAQRSTVWCSAAQRSAGLSCCCCQADSSFDLTLHGSSCVAGRLIATIATRRRHGTAKGRATRPL
jgi:hypothetical protein